jgi:hypothetical protein
MKQRFYIYTFLNTSFFVQNNKESLLHISNRKPLGKEKKSLRPDALYVKEKLSLKNTSGLDDSSDEPSLPHAKH